MSDLAASNIKVSALLTKTFSEASKTDLDAAILAFVQDRTKITEHRILAIEYAIAVGPLYSALLVYTI